MRSTTSPIDPGTGVGVPLTTTSTAPAFPYRILSNVPSEKIWLCPLANRPEKRLAPDELETESQESPRVAVTATFTAPATGVADTAASGAVGVDKADGVGVAVVAGDVERINDFVEVPLAG